MYKYIEKSNTQAIFHTRMNLILNAMHTYLAPALFNSNEKCNEIDTCLNAKSKSFFSIYNQLFTFVLEIFIQWVKQGDKCYRYLNYAIQPTCKKYRLVVHSDCHKNVANLRASGLCFLEQSPEPLICPLQQKFLVVKSVHQKRRRLTKNVIFKESYLPSLPGNGAKIWLR